MCFHPKDGSLVIQWEGRENQMTVDNPFLSPEEGGSVLGKGTRVKKDQI